MNGLIMVSFAQSLGYVAVVSIFLILTKLISDKLASNIFDADYEIEENNNNAVACRRGGLYLGTAIAMLGAVTGASKGFVSDVMLLCVEGCMIMVFMLIARTVNNKFIIRKLDNDRAIYESNTAVGVVEAGSYIATGIIAYASVIGVGGPWWSPAIYFVLGQLSLLVIVALYQVITPYDVVHEVREGNVAAGVMLCAMLIAFGLILKGAIAGPFGGWTTDLTSFSLSVISGLVMIILLFNKMIDTFFLPNTKIRIEIERDKNVAAIIVVGCVKVALAFIIGAVVL